MSPRGSGARRPDTPGPDEGRTRPRVRRVFVAIPLPDAARDEIAALIETVRAAADPDVRDVRWVRLEGLHLTLRFIGPADDAAVERLAGAVEAAAMAIDAFGVSIEGAGAFPSAGRPRAIWLGIEQGAADLAAAAGVVEDELASIGFERSDRPFRAHLTVARADGIRSGSDVAHRLIAASEGRRTSFTATELSLFETIAGGGPARYATLRTAPLGRPMPVAGQASPEPAAVLPSEPSVESRTSVGARRKEQSRGT